LDLKLENILLADNFSVKLCDFGMSDSSEETLYHNCGSETYRAPEIGSMLRNYQGFKGIQADIFSLGVILFSMHVGTMPFRVANVNTDKYFNLI
jgi:serine/threonine protein kinase